MLQTIRIKLQKFQERITSLFNVDDIQSKESVPLYLVL